MLCVRVRVRVRVRVFGRYGSRCGVWRVFRAFTSRALPATAFTCALAVERIPALVSGSTRVWEGVVSSCVLLLAIEPNEYSRKKVHFSLDKANQLTASTLMRRVHQPP